MDKRTLNNIHYRAMLAKDSNINIGSDRKYQWRLWGYLDAWMDEGSINFNEYLSIKKHYRKYFKELRKFIESRN